MRAYGPYLGFNPARWIRQTRQMRSFVRSCPPISNQERQSENFAIVVMPWLGTAVPWFSIACGVLLGAAGAKVTFVLDQLAFGTHGLRFRFVLSCIRCVLRALPRQFQTLEIGNPTLPVPLSVDERSLAARLAKLNAVWALRGETVNEGRSTYTERVVKQLELSVGAVQEFFVSHKFDCVLVPGGVYGSTGIWNALARANQTRFASFDSGGRGLVTVAANGIASQAQDIPRAFSLLKAGLKSEEERLFVRNTALAELSRRQAGVDRFSSQLKNTAALDSGFDGAVLLALNSSWDSAALGRHEIFDNSTQWIIETIKYLLGATNARIVVRQHPAERFDAGRSSDDYAMLLEESFGRDSRITFIAAGDPVNTYDLLERISVLVVYTSTIGIEAALKGKVVVTPSSSYYAELGFVWSAVAENQYQALLSEAVAGQLTVSQLMKDDALYCYYLTQCCNWVSSPFCPEGFEDWIRIPFHQLRECGTVEAMLVALRDNVPLSFLMHLEKIKIERTGARRQ
jgi:Capsule polysaccharide biosynthesis protein